jgi:signal transduction histidine kinase
MEKFGIYILEDSEKITRSKNNSRQAIYTNAAMICNNEDEDGGGWGAAGSFGPYVIVEVNFKIDLDNPTKTEVYQELTPFIQKIEQENKNRKNLEQFGREFSANVSREFKTPLASISGFAELMKTGDMNKETMQEFAGDIYKESQH